MSQQHQLSYFKKSDPMVAEMVISTLVELIAEQFNVKETFSDIQIVDCTLSIIERFWYLRPEEIMYAFKQAKLGKYGPVYNRLDTPTILNWLHRYDTEDRMQQVENQRNSFKISENEPQINIIEAYQKELEAQQKNGGTPTIVLEDREKRQKAQDERRGEIEYQNFRDEYYKARKTAESAK